MDPLSVTASCVGLLNGILVLSKQISAFAIGTRDAHKDMQAFSRELASLQLCLEALNEDDIVIQFPNKLQQSLLVILASCNDSVSEMSGLLARHASGNLGRRMQWSLFSRDQAEKIRVSLEAHKSAIEIALGMSSLSIGANIKDDAAAIRADTSYLHEIRNDTAQIGELRTEIQALRFQVLQIGQPQSETDNRLSRFLDESIAYTESIVEAQSAVGVAAVPTNTTLNHVALTNSAHASSDTSSILSDPFSSTGQSVVAPSIFSTSTSLYEFWEPLTSVTTLHPNAIPLDRRGIEASHRTRKRFPKWKKDELDQLLADAIIYTGDDRHSAEQITRCKTLLSLGAKIHQSNAHSNSLASFGTLAKELQFGARVDIIILLLSRGARADLDVVPRNACLAREAGIITELLINQGCDVNKLTLAAIEGLSLESLKALLEKDIDLHAALSACLERGWISGVECIHQVPESHWNYSAMPMRAFSLFHYERKYSEAFVRGFESVLPARSIFEPDAQLRQNYIEELRRQIPRCVESAIVKGPRSVMMKVDKVKLTSNLHHDHMTKTSRKLGQG